MLDSRVVPASLIVSIALTRWMCRSRMLYDIDSVNFALALRRFDPAVHQPHPPGYFLYVQLGRLVNQLTKDPNLALVLVSIAASCAAGAAIYRLAQAWYGRGAALGALLLFVFSPLAWFHGTVALTYIVEAFFSALVGYGCWRVWTGDARWAIPASAALALGAGFRPSLALFLGPLWAGALLRVNGKTRWLCGATAALGMAAWAVPMLHAAGGARVYWDALAQLAAAVPARRTTLADPALAAARLAALGGAFLLTFGAAALLLARRSTAAAPRAVLWLWLAPGAAFFILVFLNWVNLGYLLVLSPPLFAAMGRRVWEYLQGGRRRALLAAAAASAHCLFYFAAPVYCSHRAVRELERGLALAASKVRCGYPPEDTLILSFDSHFLGYRHAGYYLPEYLTVQYPELSYPAGKRTSVMRGRDTRLEAALPLAGYTRFVIFPLPEGAEYRSYLERVLERLPRDQMRANPPLREGPVNALADLFPSTYP